MKKVEDLLYVTTSFAYNYPLEEADVIFLGIPFSSTSISESSRYAPTIVRESMKLIEGYSKKFNLNIFKSIKFCDLGDLEVVQGNYFRTAERLIETIKEIKERNPKAFLIFIGGEHLITLPIIETLNPKSIISFDAHCDARKEYLGEEFTHATWAFHAAKKAKIYYYGVRSFSEEEKDNFDFKALREESIENPVYITIDVDVFDPSYVETGLPTFGESGKGISPKEFFNIIENIIKSQTLIAFDIVEISDNEIPSKTAMLASEIIKEVLAAMKFFNKI
ncbi:MAG: arginase family protein [Candidatus Aenigmatarchaeota archaeon]|nr:arginase family protein [Candidatus Aenigmarchaeota archaeon]